MRNKYKRRFNCDIPVPDLPDTVSNGTFVLPKRGRLKVKRLDEGFKILAIRGGAGGVAGEEYAGGGRDGTLSSTEEGEVRPPAAICVAVD